MDLDATTNSLLKGMTWRYLLPSGLDAHKLAKLNAKRVRENWTSMQTWLTYYKLIAKRYDLEVLIALWTRCT